LPERTKCNRNKALNNRQLKSYMNNGAVEVKDNNKQRKDTRSLMSERDCKWEL
jgi:hypothetical protein